jgi:hypothetical protein
MNLAGAKDKHGIIADFVIQKVDLMDTPAFFYYQNKIKVMFVKIVY